MKNPIRRNYDIAGAFAMLAGLLSTPLFLLEGWSSRAELFLVIGIIWICLGLLLRSRRRWLAWLAYILTLLAIIVTLIGMATSSIGAWWWILILFFHAGGAFLLFRILWADKGAFDKA